MSENENESLESLLEDLPELPDLEDVLGEDDDKEEGPGSLSQRLLAVLSHHTDSEDDEDDEDPEDDADDADKSAVQYHNTAIEYARRGHNTDAVNLCIRGLTKFPTNVDLLADVVKYSSNAGDMETAHRYFLLLMDMPREQYNWRAFAFSLDHLLENVLENEDACRALIADYHRVLPHDEKAYVAESELEEKLGNHERSLEILQEAIQKLPNAPQSALRLADKQFERGRYMEAIQTTSYAFAASSESQPSISISYLVLLRLLAEDAVLHQRLMKGDPVTQQQIDQMREKYRTFEDAFPVAGMQFKGAIIARMGILAFAVPTA